MGGSESLGSKFVEEWRGWTWRGSERHGAERMGQVAKHGKERPSAARQDSERKGRARLDLAWLFK